MRIPRLYSRHLLSESYLRSSLRIDIDTDWSSYQITKHGTLRISRFPDFKQNMPRKILLLCLKSLEHYPCQSTSFPWVFLRHMLHGAEWRPWYTWWNASRKWVHWQPLWTCSLLDNANHTASISKQQSNRAIVAACCLLGIIMRFSRMLNVCYSFRITNQIAEWLLVFQSLEQWTLSWDEIASQYLRYLSIWAFQKTIRSTSDELKTLENTLKHDPLQEQPIVSLYLLFPFNAIHLDFFCYFDYNNIFRGDVFHSRMFSN